MRLRDWMWHGVRLREVFECGERIVRYQNGEVVYWCVSSWVWYIKFNMSQGLDNFDTPSSICIHVYTDFAKFVLVSSICLLLQHDT
jgi:hypothetical protein